MAGHTLTWEVDDYEYAYVTCCEPEGANCRLMCPDPRCETWVVERDTDGLDGVAFHQAGDEKHVLVPCACTAADWFDNSGVSESHTGGAEVIVADRPIDVKWDDGYTWRFSKE